MRAHSQLFGWILLAGLTYAGPAKDTDDGLRLAFERVVYQLKGSTPGRFQGVNPAQRLELEFSSDEALLKHPQGDTALRLTGYGYGARRRMPLQAKPTVSGNRVEYQRGELSEWYVNDSRGLEQGFTLARRPGVSEDGEPLVIALGVSGGLRPELAESAVLLQSGNKTVLRYDGLVAWDARSRVLPAKLEVGEREVRLVVDDRAAEYPVVVDPVWTQRSELLASDGAVGDSFGWSVSVSGDIAVIGAYGKKIGSNTSQGAVYVFTHSGTTWTQQQELTASDGVGGDWFGYSVSVSGDTLVVGAPQKNVGSNVAQGAAYVFVLLGSTWILQQELTSSSAGNFGWSVSLDGDTALIGASGSTVNMNPNQGSAYVYIRSASTWGLQQQLTASNGVTSDQFGYSVSVSGNTALIGALNKKIGTNSFQGATYVFTRSGSSWANQVELTASDGAANDEFGYSVALNGYTAVIGAPYKKVGTKASQGVAYVFASTDGGHTWTQQAELSASNGAAGDEFGYSVAVSGSRVLIGAVFKTINGALNQGAAYVFVGSGSTWTQQQELTASDGTSQNWFGSSVALSGNTVAVGATWRLSTTGAVYMFKTPYVYNDFAGNGLSGVVLYDPTSGQEYTALSNGDGTFTYVPNLFTPHFSHLITGDYNGDGIADLILYNSSTALAYIGFGRGDGTFNFQSLFWSPGYTKVLTGDIYGDGKTDVLLYNGSTGTMYTGISNGDGTFNYTYTLISGGYTYLRLADFNGDGLADLFVYNATTGASYLGIGSGTGTFTFYPQFISPGYDMAHAGDLNGDGKEDIILYDSTNGNAVTGISNASNGFNFTPLIFSPGFTSVRLGNYTGSGLASVTVYNKTTAAAYFGTGTGTGTFTFQSLFWSPGYDSVVPEDVNGDGKTDAVLYNSATGTEYTAISNGDGTFSYTYQFWGTGKVLAQ
jgi:hypothetical protein